MMPKCDNKATETDLASIDDEDEHPLPSEEESSSSTGNAKTDRQEVMKPSYNEQRSIVEYKQPKTIKNIMMALKEGKARENGSPMRGSHIRASGALTQKANTETLSKLPKFNAVTPSFKHNSESPTVAPAKTSPDPTKRMQGLHALKNQVLCRWKFFTSQLAMFDNIVVMLVFIHFFIYILHSGRC